MNGFPAAATGVSTSPPTAKQLIQFTSRFVNEYACFGDGLSWGPNRVNRVVVKFHNKFPAGSWLMFWRYLAWHISDIADGKIARRAQADLYRFISYADPTGETAVRNAGKAITRQEKKG